jgi:hypothetical protein
MRTRTREKRRVTVRDLLEQRLERERCRRAREFKRITKLIANAIHEAVDQRLAQRGTR